MSVVEYVIRFVHIIFIAAWRAKRQNPHMNPRKATIAILAALSVSLALADDFKTNSGKEYKNATVTQVEADGIVIKTKVGISKTLFSRVAQRCSGTFPLRTRKSCSV